MTFAAAEPITTLPLVSSPVPDWIFTYMVQVKIDVYDDINRLGKRGGGVLIDSNGNQQPTNWFLFGMNHVFLMQVHLKNCIQASLGHPHSFNPFFAQQKMSSSLYTPSNHPHDNQ